MWFPNHSLFSEKTGVFSPIPTVCHCQAWSLWQECIWVSATYFDVVFSLLWKVTQYVGVEKLVSGYLWEVIFLSIAVYLVCPWEEIHSEASYVTLLNQNFPLPFIKIALFAFVIWLSSLYIFFIWTPFQINILQIFHPSQRSSFYFADTFFAVQKPFLMGIISLVYLYFWYHIHKNHCPD